MSNHLINESSPYLLQHANNPVNWYPWGEEALARARAEEKPIFLSIGYAACHWCHVMAHESFEDETTAAFMNEHFINIKVDREERPDLDGIYMAAVVALTGGGGWPMSIFLTPQLRPFYGGTYFPPKPRYNLPSFRDVLSGLVEAWKNRREEIDRIGTQLHDHLTRQTVPRAGSVPFTPEMLALAEKNLIDSYDWGYGGWGAAPKFPQAMTIEFLLTRAALTQTESPGTKAATHALKAMARGGMYDVVGGGFSRYSTDNFWRVPHFEKMLYDNALLARAYLHAYQVTGVPAFRRVVEETLDFVAREMTHPQGGFYSSLDADSEGMEGKFYVWTRDEIQAVLTDPSDFDFFVTAYGITEPGNWEGKTVLQRALDDASLAARFQLDVEAVSAKLTECHARLLTVRNTRVRPGTDDKILTAWNGLMLAAFAEAARVLTSPYVKLDGPSDRSITSATDASPVSPLRTDIYLNMATRNAGFLLSQLRPEGRLRRSWRDGKATNEVFLEDYAALILGLLELYQTDFETKWFVAAIELSEEMLEEFSDPDAGGFFDTPLHSEALLVRPKDIQDNATPSGNALAAEALFKLSTLSERSDLREHAEEALRLVSGFAVQYATGFARWLSAAEFALAQVKQVAIIGERKAESTQGLIQAARAAYRPNVMVAASEVPPKEGAPALLRDRPLIAGQATAYVCEGFVCKQPVTTAEDLLRQLREE